MKQTAKPTSVPHPISPETPENYLSDSRMVPFLKATVHDSTVIRHTQEQNTCERSRVYRCTKAIRMDGER